MRTVYEPMFLLLYVIIVSFFTFFFQGARKTGSNCAITCFNFSMKHKLALYTTQSGESNYVDHKFFFNIFLGATCTKTLGLTFKYYRAG